MLLDAALACVLDVGLRRTTLADVARRAGVSRMTVYRRFADLDGLVSALLTRELVAVLAAVERQVAPLPTARQRLVGAATEVVARTAEHPLYQRIVTLDPELLLPLVVDRLGSTQRAALAAIREQLDQGRADGSIRVGDLDDAAVAVLLTAQSFVFSGRVAGGAFSELPYLLDAYLAAGLTGTA